MRLTHRISLQGDVALADFDAIVIGSGMSGGRMIKEPMIVANRMIEEIK